jgi:hypothetical protein
MLGTCADLPLSGSLSRIRRTSHFHATLNYTCFIGKYRTGKFVHEFSTEANANGFLSLMKDTRVHLRCKQSNSRKIAPRTKRRRATRPARPRIG